MTKVHTYFAEPCHAAMKQWEMRNRDGILTLLLSRAVKINLLNFRVRINVEYS
jgi:hypothetical protein